MARQIVSSAVLSGINSFNAYAEAMDRQGFELKHINSHMQVWSTGVIEPTVFGIWTKMSNDEEEESPISYI